MEQTGNDDVLEVDLSSGKVRNVTKNLEFMAKPYPEFMSKLINSGGLIEYTKQRLADRRI